MTTAVAGLNSFLPMPANVQESQKLAEMLASSKMIPAHFQNRPSDVMVAMMWSANLGLPFLQGIQGIAVINGRPSIWGDTALAVVRSSGKLEDFEETIEGEGDQMKAVCRANRKDQTTPIVRTFSVQDAKDAGLWGRNTWKAYPKRMLQMRARAFALRDGFTDVLSGMSMAEEIQDEPLMKDMGQVEEVGKRPRKKTKETAKSEPVIDVAEEVKPELVPVVEQQDSPVVQTAEIEDVVEPVDVSDWVTKIDEAKSSKEITALWKEAPPEIKTALRSEFTKKGTELKHAEAQSQ